MFAKLAFSNEKAIYIYILFDLFLKKEIHKKTKKNSQFYLHQLFIVF